jgi:hypothetical protein
MANLQGAQRKPEQAQRPGIFTDPRTVYPTASRQDEAGHRLEYGEPSYDPLTLYRLIEKTVLAQTEDQYLFATVYDLDIAFYGFKQESLSNVQWYERLNTKVDISAAVGVTRQDKVLVEYVAQEQHNQAFDDLTLAEQQVVRDDAEERYVSYCFLRQSGSQHNNLKTDLQNDFTTGDNKYPKTRQQTLHLFDKYSKTAVAKATISEGTSFAQ